MLWSILLAGIPERYHSVQPLLFSLLESQHVARMPDVELVYLMDNRRRTVGSKRNALLDMSHGEYVSFVDDDDEVAADYVARIYREIVKTRKEESPADVICFNQRALIQPHAVIHECSYSLSYWRDREPNARRQIAVATDASGEPVPNTLAWTGPPAHTQVWRRATIADDRFTNKTFGEDVEWIDRICARATKEIQLGGQPLYIYKFSEEGSATR